MKFLNTLRNAIRFGKKANEVIHAGHELVVEHPEAIEILSKITGVIIKEDKKLNPDTKFDEGDKTPSTTKKGVKKKK